MSQIPVITDPLGKHWQQPDPSNILIDETHALMSARDFDKLLDYSLSQPSGVYVGKMWKSQQLDKQCRPMGKWFLLWFGECEQPGYVSNNCRQIIICD